MVMVMAAGQHGRYYPMQSSFLSMVAIIFNHIIGLATRQETFRQGKYSGFLCWFSSCT